MEFRQRRRVIPRQPLTRVERYGLMVALQCNQVLEGRDVVELGGVDQAHKHVAHTRAGKRSIVQGILTIR